MIKKISILVIASAMLCLAACGKEPEHYAIEAKTVSFDSFEEMEESSDVIVKGIRQSGEEAVLTTVNGDMASGYTLSEFEITDVFKDTSGTLESGNIITILENEVYNEAENEVYHIDGYNMMVEGKEYLLFLKKSTLDGSEYYVSRGVNCGTVSLQEDGRTVQRLTREGKEGTDFSYYEPFWEAAKEKYLNQ